MNTAQSRTRQALIGQVAGLLVGSKPLGGKKVKKMPFVGTATTGVTPGGATVRIHPEHQPIYRQGPYGGAGRPGIGFGNTKHGKRPPPVKSGPYGGKKVKFY